MIRSMASFSWAMTLFGARQMGNLLLADTDRATAAFNAVAEATRSGLGESWSPLLRTSDRYQSRLVDLTLPASRQSVELGLEMIEMSAKALAAVPGHRSTGLELSNKLQAYKAYQSVERLPGMASDIPLETRVEQAAGLTPYRRLWVMEGLGFAHAERAWKTFSPPQELLRDIALSTSVALIPLHTGMGLSLAMRTFKAVDTRGTDEALTTALEGFRALCERNAAPDCSPMAFEALGLVIRTLHPHLLRRVDRMLAAIDPELVDFYWHGVGRALYFLPLHLLPGLSPTRRALEKARREPPHETGRRNALAGLAWAITLVNFRHPEVLQSLLDDHLDAIYDQAAFANGVSAATRLWYQTNGRETHLENLLTTGSDCLTPELWRRLVTGCGEIEPADDDQHASLASLFRYRPSNGIPLHPGGDLRCDTPMSAAWGQEVDGLLSRALQALSAERGV